MSSFIFFRNQTLDTAYPIIKSARLTLTNISMNDLEDLHLLNSEPLVDQYNTLGIPKDLEETKELILNRVACNETIPRTRYILRVANETQHFIGMAGINFGKPKYFNAEIWYRFHPNFWNKGYATEAVTALLDFGFNELKLHRIEAGVVIENTASIHVLEKTGFLREGQHRKLIPIRGEWKDNFSYAILDTDFFSGK
jgi:[ribosomal protein S5]-alanine N-acetyltransferase